MTRIFSILILLILTPGTCLAYTSNNLHKQLDLYGRADDREIGFMNQFRESWAEVQNATGPLVIDGDVLGYWQGYADSKIAGDKKEGRDYGGFKARLRLNWKPVENGQLFIQLQGGQADTGSNPSSRGMVATPLNSLASRTTAGGQASISDVLYTHHFAKDKFFVTLGWSEPESFLDANRFAGNGRTQFTNTIFNNEPIFDLVDENHPIIAVGYSPVEKFKFTFLAQSISRSALPRDQQKQGFDNLLDDPFLGGQLTYSPSFGNLPGNYRLFGWTNTYKQTRLDGNGDSANWGFAFNMDQNLTKDFGIFARVGKGNSAVNNITWSWSLGTNWQACIPGRDEDVWGVAAGGVQGNKHTANSDMEFHYETFYQIKISNNFSIVPDLTYVSNSLATNGNDDIVFGMLKFFFSFSTP
ncbi:carbohydrate porin [Maridesulfovibrio ferrireducens]|uniref:carbohydrate porin n=1 Tax=Maridesulfovibrio ferrireducens TaxID=246191 RepID=UPI001A322676|nr:carbohydrate porin [Maridesulfovibrio ferrireducens]MBI9111717.1 carbohydrate porin [Maridesulfovibrio ferrireducens]